MIAEYIWLRDNRKAEEEKFETWVKDNYSLRMRQIELDLLAFLDTTGGDKFGSEETGVVYRKVSKSVTIADMQAFQRHVIGIQDFDLIDWRANKTAMTKLVEQHEDLPPGVNYSEFVTVGVRKRG
jgi:hypothetical protein